MQASQLEWQRHIEAASHLRVPLQLPDRLGRQLGVGCSQLHKVTAGCKQGEGTCLSCCLLAA